MAASKGCQRREYRNELWNGYHGREGKEDAQVHDNVPDQLPHDTQKKVAYLGFQYLDQPPYSPDLAPSDYHLLPGLKKTIESSPFFVRRGGHCCRGDLVGRTTI